MAKMLMRSPWYSRPHNFNVTYGHGIESGVNNYATIIPVAMNDEGLGSPSDYEAHPENALFVEAAEPNCYTESRLNFVNVELIFSLTKSTLVTDDVDAIRVAYMPIFVSFDDIIANDELSGLDIGEILELQRETVDRQCYPLYNGVDMKDIIVGSGLLPTNVPGLTATQLIEGVTFIQTDYYNCLQYLTNGPKLKKCQGGLKFLTLTRKNPIARIRIRLRSKVKRVKAYTFFGVMTLVPPVASQFQVPVAGDTTDVIHVRVSARVRFDEWNPEFNMKRV